MKVLFSLVSVLFISASQAFAQRAPELPKIGPVLHCEFTPIGSHVKLYIEQLLPLKVWRQVMTVASYHNNPATSSTEFIKASVDAYGIFRSANSQFSLIVYSDQPSDPSVPAQIRENSTRQVSEGHCVVSGIGRQRLTR